MTDRLRSLQQTLKLRWQGLSPRERHTLLAGGLFLLLVFFFFFVLSPWLSAQKKMQRNLPGLRADLAHMRALAQSATRLKALDLKLGASELANELRRKISPLNLPPERIDIQAQAEKGLIQLTLKQVDFNQWITWQEAQNRAYRLRILSAHLDKTGEAGLVNVRLTLALPASGKNE